MLFSMNNQTLVIKKPFDSHVHFRRGAMLRAVAPFTAKQCWGGLVMPNTAPHIFTPEDAEAYAAEVRATIGNDFKIVMAGYLTPTTNVEDLKRGFASGAWGAMKVYPPGATTHSTEGVAGKDLVNHPALSVMQEIGMPVLLHGEINKDEHGEEIDIYDREKRFLEEIVPQILEKYPTLKISLEHVTTKAMAEFMEKNGKAGRLVCTITPQHLLFDRRMLHKDGFQPHLFCYPILKRKEDKEAIRKLAAAGHDFVSAGTDSAPHPTQSKEKAAGCAGGVFSAHAMIEMYTQGFDELSALDKLEAFLSINGPKFFGLEASSETITLAKENWTVDEMVGVEGGDKVRPFGYDEKPENRFPFVWRLK